MAATCQIKVTGKEQGTNKTVTAIIAKNLAADTINNVSQIVKAFQPLVTYQIEKASVIRTQDYDIEETTPGTDTWATNDKLVIKFTSSQNKNSTMSYNRAATPNDKAAYESYVQAFCDLLAPYNQDGTDAYINSQSDTSVWNPDY